ncbi:class I SAM-dependent methyltransferase [Tsukamurella sp. 8F]|uniref:class I SAM-dependent methyltransferase n=1 Tax=unclassified Tsukamurella TaxID=2633480 RepID=UPI0023B9C101|nr:MULTISPECIES: class I SAM-dependent methyltransferase [unclassified Tsukamurella]MDF0528950.1 class I SAM-dependent methyltransferase [Tsukamurella sp. 8J]MDF0589154.1 class I SAM-dependent methyltransferase [Tsukamurella sp. 8F]
MVNEEMRTTWTGGACAWVEHQQMFDRVYSPVTAAILAVADLGPRRRVLDIGCGTGTLLEAAGAVGAVATGVDISPAMTEAASHRVPTASVLLADAQDTDLSGAPGAPFDRVVSRFGVMFFEDATAAFANIRRACEDGARLTFACWRAVAENPTFTLGTTVLTTHLAAPPAPPRADAPGPMAFADPAYVRRLLEAAGWAEIDVVPLDFECIYGADDDDGVEDRMDLILGTTTGRAAAAELVPRLGPDAWAGLLEDVRAELRLNIVDGHVRHPGACWLVTAQA